MSDSLFPNSLRAKGVCDYACEGYVLASRAAGIDIASRDDQRVVQAIGNATASAGYHKSDGTLQGTRYTAAIDLSVKGLSSTQLVSWLDELCRAGFVAFYRNWKNNQHIHANYAGVPMKVQLDGQNEDFFEGKDGLRGHSRIDDEWWFPEIELRAIPKAMFRLSNPVRGEGKCVRSPLALALIAQRSALRSVATAPLAVTNPELQTPSLGFYLNDEAKPRFWMPLLDGVSYAPVRALGDALGFDTHYVPQQCQITYDGKPIPIALKIIGGVGHAPVRSLLREVGLRILSVDVAAKTVRAGR